MFFSIYFMPDSRSYERWWRYSYFGVKTSATQHYKWPEKWRVFGLALYKNMWVGWESKVPPLCECLSAANRIQGTKRKKLGGGRQWAASYSSALGYKEEPRGQSVVPRSQLEWGGASAQHTSDLPSLCLCSCWERWRYQQICVCSATPQISPLQIVSGRGNGTWLGFWNDYWWQCPSGAAFINVPINFTCPALFCFH